MENQCVQALTNVDKSHLGWWVRILCALPIMIRTFKVYKYLSGVTGKIYFEMDSIEPIGPENHVSNQLLTPGQLFLLLTYRNRPPASTMHHGPLISHMIYSQTIAKLYITWPHNEYYSRVLLLFDGHICRGFM